MSRLDTFRRAMRRHERRARERGLPHVTVLLRRVRLGTEGADIIVRSAEARAICRDNARIYGHHMSRRSRTWNRRSDWIYARAAEAVAKLQAAGSP